MSVEAWRECASWLTRCSVLAEDHRANWASAEVLDLAYTLRDGVQLCRLLDVLEAGCVDPKDVNLRPQLAQFLCLRNIRTFLQSSRNVFDLRESDLFEPSMLFDLTDFGKVLHTLSKLSNCPKAQRKGIKGFSIQNHVQEEDIYRRLEDLANDNFPPTSPAPESGYDRLQVCPGGQSWAQLPPYDSEEGIYEDLCYVTFRTTQIPALVSPALEKRDYICRELLETEKNYMEALNMIKSKYMRPLNPVMREDDWKIVFFGIKDLSAIHTGFYSSLCKVCLPGSSHRLSDAFLTWKEKFVLYGDYCANLPRAQALVEEMCSKSDLVNQKILKCQQEANDGRFRLRDVLSVPMQRILKYHLLLDKLIGETQESHSDYVGLQKALESMRDVANFINEVKRDSETLQIISDIQASISDWNMPENTGLKDYGRLLKDGELKIRCHDDTKPKLRYVFVFDRVMLMCKTTRGEQHSYRHSLCLQDYKVEDVNNRRVMNRDGRWTYHWYLVHRQEKMAYTMHARNEEQKRRWIKAIQDALENIHPSECEGSDHEFEMHTFEKPTVCDECGKLLKGLFYQGYYCTRCKTSVHKECISRARRCGVSNPPELPPRPPLSPIRAVAPVSFSSQPSVQSSTTSGDTTPATPDHHRQPSFSEPPPSLCSQSSHLDYTNLWKLDEFSWFIGETERDLATSLLEREPNGTFLLRIRPQRPATEDESGYALTLKTNDQVKHMKIFWTAELDGGGDGTRRFYLSDSRCFRSIPELVTWYEQHSLSENFNGLDATLERAYVQRAYTQRVVAVAMYDYSTSEANQLPLKKGDCVTILSKEGGSRGWWKGQIGDRIGYFPASYVSEDACQ